MKVMIVDDSRGRGCEGACGLDWSRAETIALAEKQIEARYRQPVRVGYLDLSQHGNEAARFEQLVDRGNLPVLLVNEQPRIWGRFDIRMLLEVIGAEIEIGGR